MKRIVSLVRLKDSRSVPMETAARNSASENSAA